MSAHVRLEIARQQIQSAREYTLTLLEGIDDPDWFQQPGGGVTHIAWQVGHLAMAEYGLCLFRQRGRGEIDGQLMSSKFRKQFSKGSTPNPDPDSNPPPSEILDTLHGVHRQAMKELPGYSDEQLNEPVDMPYAGFPTKLGSLLFCAHHEMLHAGQIGLLRRLLGKDPVR